VIDFGDQLVVGYSKEKLSEAVKARERFRPQGQSAANQAQ
jgi:hypothetical protein